ncbi:Protein of unknown function, partial [Cotesia congregata]
LFQGTVWKEVAAHYNEKTVIPHYIYYDEFGVGDPLSPAATLHKMDGLCYSIAALPPKLSSKFDTVLLAQLIYNSDYKEFKNAKCYCKVISELIPKVRNPGKGVLQNRGEAELLFLSFLLSFQRSTKTVYGIKEECVFNSISNFHNIKSLTCDIRHDFYLDVCRYDMARIIKGIIYYTLNDLNDRLKYFDFSKVDHGNKITNISQKHISQGYIIITGAEMSSLVTYFGIIIGDNYS